MNGRGLQGEGGAGAVCRVQGGDEWQKISGPAVMGGLCQVAFVGCKVVMIGRRF